MTNDFFERLGLPRRFDLSPAEVEREYLARSREVHPDFHQLGGAVEQRASLEMSSALNEAYSTLRDPFRRAEYLLGLEGGPSAADVREMPATFLMEMLELREAIEELRSSTGPDSSERLAMEGQLAERRDRLLGEAGKRFARLEALPAGDAGRAGLLKEIRQLLNATKYVQGLLRDLRAD